MKPSNILSINVVLIFTVLFVGAFLYSPMGQAQSNKEKAIDCARKIGIPIRQLQQCKSTNWSGDDCKAKKSQIRQCVMEGK